VELVIFPVLKNDESGTSAECSDAELVMKWLYSIAEKLVTLCYAPCFPQW
jgi:hypothetical protein